jgi:beta-glucosidase
VPGVASSLSGDIDFYVGKPIEPWRVFIRNSSTRQFLSGSFAALNEGDVKVATLDNDVQEDALHFTFTITPVASLTLEDGSALNLSHIAKAGGVMSMEIQNIKHQGAMIELIMTCGFNCERKVPLSNYFASIADKGWQKLEVSLSCFAEEGDTFESMPLPFTLRTSGSGEVGVANVRFLLTPSASQECPN